MPSMTDPTDALVSFQQALLDGEIRLQRGELDPDIFVHTDRPTSDVARITYVRLDSRTVKAFVNVISAGSVEGLPCFQLGVAVPEQYRNKGYAKSTLASAIAELTNGLKRNKILSFPKIISGRIGDAALPRLEWREWCQTVGLHDARVRLSVMPSVCALDCNTLHRRKGFAAGAPRRRWPYDPGTRDAMCRSGVPQCRFATETLARSAGHGYPSPSPDAEIYGRRLGHCRAKGRLGLESRDTPQ